MKVVNVEVGSVVVDSLPFSQAGTPAQALGLLDRKVRCLVGYLGAINKDRIKFLHDCGIGYMPVTFAGEYKDGPADELAQLKALCIPEGTTVWLDLEGKVAWDTEPTSLIKMLEAWSKPIVAAGYIAGLYCGVPQPLTSSELWKLSGFTRYWKGQGRQVDRNGRLAEPEGCGWCMYQMFPSITMGGLLVDANMVGQDYRGRVPTMVVP
jgi:hypothetical protein